MDYPWARINYPMSVTAYSVLTAPASPAPRGGNAPAYVEPKLVALLYHVWDVDVMLRCGLPLYTSCHPRRGADTGDAQDHG